MNTPFQPGDVVQVLTEHVGNVGWYDGRVQQVHPMADGVLNVLVECSTIPMSAPGWPEFFMVDVECDQRGHAMRLQHVPFHGLCTCHHPPKPMMARTPRSEWEHDHDQTYAEVFHVHAYSNSRDCDGPRDSAHTYQVKSLRDCEDKDDLWRRAVAMELSPHGEQTVTIHGDAHMAEFSERTEEGYHNAMLRGCVDPDCAHEGSSQRDHYAEAMGY